MSHCHSELKKEFEGELRYDEVQRAHEKAYERVMSMVEEIQDDRQNDYGDAEESHDNIAKFWNAYLERKKFSAVFDGLDATDVAVMLSLMKISRLAYKRKHDSFVDFAAYADFALQFETKGE